MTTASPLERAARAWRAWALGLALAVAAVTTLGLIAAGEPPGRAARATAPVQAFDAYRGPASTDSLEPMLAAYRQAVTQPGGDLYSVFFKDHVKFQYPPSSLLLFDALPRAWTVGPPAADAPSARVARPMRRFWTVLCYLATVLTVLASAVALELRLRLVQDPAGPAGMSLREALGRLTHPIPWRGLALSGALGLVYYPLVAGYDLGNIQVVLGALAAVALLSQVLGRDVPSALCLGLCVLVKPQWGLVLLWALTRRRWRFAVVFLGVALVGTAVALARFGVHDHLRYLDVLGAIGGTGEVYWPNQSANGLVNRLLGNGDAIHWQSGGFAPPHPIVKAVTLLTSLAMLALALWPGRAARRGGTGASDATASSPEGDLPLALVAATMASPVAWEHHYGAFLPVFALALPLLARDRPLGARTAPVLAFSYLAIGSAFLRPEWLFAHRVTGVLGSHVFFGGLALFALLWIQRRRGTAL